MSFFHNNKKQTGQNILFHKYQCLAYIETLFLTTFEVNNWPSQLPWENNEGEVLRNS